MATNNKLKKQFKESIYYKYADMLVDLNKKYTLSEGNEMLSCYIASTMVSTLLRKGILKSGISSQVLLEVEQRMKMEALLLESIRSSGNAEEFLKVFREEVEKEEKSKDSSAPPGKKKK